MTVKNKKVYICTTNLCNLHCDGCYMNASCNLSQESINLNFVRQFLDKTLQETEDVECVFHGGEPFFDLSKVQDYIDLVKDYPQVKWSATTNLAYLITPKLFELFSLFTDKFMKTSWDVDDYRFKTQIHRVVWEDNVKYLQSIGYNIQVIVTVNTKTITHKPEEILNYFTTLGVKEINFERITETGRAAEVKVKPTNREVDDWLFEAYTYNKNNTHLKIALFDELEGVAQGGDWLGCRKRECMTCVSTLTSNNCVSTCPNLSTCHIGVYNGKSVEYDHEAHDKLIKMEKSINSKCLACKFYNICHAECCQLPFDDTGCPGLVKILEEICI